MSRTECVAGPGLVGYVVLPVKEAMPLGSSRPAMVVDCNGVGLESRLCSRRCHERVAETSVSRCKSHLEDSCRAVGDVDPACY